MKNRTFLLPLFLLLLLMAVDLLWSRNDGFTPIRNLPDWWFDFRLPRVLAAAFAGVALSSAGLALQTLFRNPLAGPFLTGITPGASFAIGLLLLVFPNGFANPVWQQIGLTGVGMAGGIAILLLQLLVVRHQHGMFTLLLTGVLLSYLLGALVEVMQYIASAEQVKSYVMWGLGNFDRVVTEQLYWFLPLCTFGTLWLFLERFRLDAWLPGELYARNAGVNTGKFKLSIILISGLLAGSATAICGPIGFVGLAAPHLAKIAFRSNQHGTILIPTAIWGACLCLLADIVAHNAMQHLTLNVNSICAMIGAPLVLWVVLRSRSTAN